MTKEYRMEQLEPEEFFCFGVKKAAQKNGCLYGGGCYALYHQQECHDCLKAMKEVQNVIS